MYLSIGGLLLRHKLKRCCGFTLVEILIVMLIISVLAGMVMFAAVNAFDNAAAIKIVNDFKIIQKASVLSKIENKEWWPGEAPTGLEEKKVSDLAAMFTDSPNINAGKAYGIWGGSNSSGYGIFFWVDLNKIKRTDQMKSIFKAKANGGFGVKVFDKNYSTADLKANKGKSYNGGDRLYFCISDSYY